MGNKDRAYEIDGIAYWCSPWDVDDIENSLEADFAHQLAKRSDWLTVTTVNATQPALSN